MLILVLRVAAMKKLGEGVVVTMLGIGSAQVRFDSDAKT